MMLDTRCCILDTSSQFTVVRFPTDKEQQSLSLSLSTPGKDFSSLRTWRLGGVDQYETSGIHRAVLLV